MMHSLASIVGELDKNTYSFPRSSMHIAFMSKQVDPLLPEGLGAGLS